MDEVQEPTIEMMSAGAEVLRAIVVSFGDESASASTYDDAKKVWMAMERARVLEPHLILARAA